MILHHASGLHQIIGTLSELGVAPVSLPSDLRNMSELDGADATLGRIEPRYVLYREVVPPIAAYML